MRSTVCYAHEHRSDAGDTEIRQLNSARLSADGSWGFPPVRDRRALRKANH